MRGAGTLTLIRPQAGVVATFDADAYSVIDLLLIENQWAALVQVGVTLRIVFPDGSVIELLNFYSHSRNDDASGDTGNGDGYTGALPEFGRFAGADLRQPADVIEGVCPDVREHKNQRLLGHPCIRRS